MTLLINCKTESIVNSVTHMSFALAVSMSEINVDAIWVAIVMQHMMLGKTDGWKKVMSKSTLHLKLRIDQINEEIERLKNPNRVGTVMWPEQTKENIAVLESEKAKLESEMTSFHMEDAVFNDPTDSNSR